MYSACNSSQISSVDSYLSQYEDGARSLGIDDLVKELGSSVDVNSSYGSTSPSSGSSVSGLSFSSDEDFFKELEDSTTYGTGAGGAKKSSAGAQPVSKFNKKHRAKSSTKSHMNCAEWLKSEEAEKSPVVRVRRTRSAMGTYIPPPGGQPLTKYFTFSSPGPKYYPNFNVVKPNAPEYLLKFRIKEKGQEIGPGPGAYNIRKNVCTNKYIDKHFAKRFPDFYSDGPGPANYDLDEHHGIGKCKPKARLVGRHHPKTQKYSVPLQNCYGLTRFGRFCSPHAIILSKPIIIDKSEPGPGAYGDLDLGSSKGKIRRGCRRIGITIKGRPKKDIYRDDNIPGPKYDIPNTLKGPAWPLVGRWKDDSKANASPGPIYFPTSETKKPVSMTFRPFPMRGKEEEPSPLSYKNVGEQHLKTKPVAPKTILLGRRDVILNADLPGPNQYAPPSKIGFSSYNQCSLKGRWKFQTTIGPGPGQYSIPSCPPRMRRPPKCIFVSCTKTLNEKTASEQSPGFIYNPKVDRGSVRNVYLAPRWKPITKASDNVPFRDLTGFTQRGKSCRTGVSFKSRQTPFIFNGTSTAAYVPKAETCDIERLKYGNGKGRKAPINVQERWSAGRKMGKAIESMKTAQPCS